MTEFLDAFSRFATVPEYFGEEITFKGHLSWTWKDWVSKDCTYGERRETNAM